MITNIALDNSSYLNNFYDAGNSPVIIIIVATNFPTNRIEQILPTTEQPI